MGERLSSLTQRYRAAPQGVLAEITHPVLVWEAAPPEVEKMEGDLIWKTDPGRKLKVAGDDPVVFMLKKITGKNNAFGLGVTLGRTQNNDLAIDDASISRFHAWFQIDPLSGVWHVADAESSNGTWCGVNRLSPKRSAPLTDGSQVRVGDIQLLFLVPVSFHQWVLKKIGTAK